MIINNKKKQKNIKMKGNRWKKWKPVHKKLKNRVEKIEIIDATIFSRTKIWCILGGFRKYVFFCIILKYSFQKHTVLKLFIFWINFFYFLFFFYLSIIFLINFLFFFYFYYGFKKLKNKRKKIIFRLQLIRMLISIIVRYSIIDYCFME